MNWLRFFLLLMLVFVLSACDSLAYYRQAASGHFELMDKRESLAEAKTSAAYSEELKRRLTLAESVRRYASEVLHLPDNEAYSTYVHLDQDYVMWSVFATPRLSLTPKQWCYPMVGCLSYRGYYDEAEAQAYAAELEAEGWDTHVSGVAAYSTLGWYEDPLTTAMLRYEDPWIARLVFHELSHQQLYVDDDTPFNEGFAVAVEEEGVMQWLSDRQDEQGQEQWLASREQREVFLTMIREAQQSLNEVYRSELNDEEKLSAKQRVMDELVAAYQERLLEPWPDSGYAHWFARPINNARLAAIGVYREYVPAFRALFTRCDEDWSRFYRSVEQLADLPMAQRMSALHTKDCA